MLKIGVVGCTGAVGLTFLELLTARPAQYEVLCFASKKSAGTMLDVGGRSYPVQEFSVDAAGGCDVVFLCVSGDFSKEYGPILAERSYVVDNSSAFRYVESIPLLVPPINGCDYGGERLIANPNCSSAIALMVLGPLHREYGIEQLIVSTYQAASGAGKPAMIELRESVASFNDYSDDRHSQYFFHDLAFNVVPQVDKFEANGYTREEMKVVWEIRKVLNAPNLAISTTAVRVPTLRSHAESITVKFSRPVTDMDAVQALLRQAPGVEVRDIPGESVYPMPKSSTYKHAVEVGRIRQNLIFGQYGIDMFVSGDQLLRGAALNAFEILQLLEARKLFD